MEIDWQQLLSEHGPVVWRKLRSLVGNEADASDCYQNVFLEAFRLSKHSCVDDWNALLGRIARMRALDVLRKRYRRDAVMDPAACAAETFSRLPSPEDVMQANELSERLRVAIASIAPQQAEAFVMRYIEHLTYDEIAERTDSNRNAVGVMLNRAKRQLRFLLRDDSIEHKAAQSTTGNSSEETS